MPADQPAMQGNAVRIVHTDTTRFQNPSVHCAVRILGAAGSGHTRIQAGVKSAVRSDRFVTALGNVWMQMDARHAVQSTNLELLDKLGYVFERMHLTAVSREKYFPMILFLAKHSIIEAVATLFNIQIVFCYKKIEIFDK